MVLPVQTEQSRQRLKRRSILILRWLNMIFQGSTSIIMVVSSIIIAIQQHVIIQENREKDLWIVAQQRQQYLEIEQLQREEELNISSLQHEEDLKIFQLQRDQDRHILQFQRKIDREIIEAERTHTELLQTAHWKLIDEQYMDDLHISYTNKIEDFAIENDRQQEDIFQEYQQELLSSFLQYGFERVFQSQVLLFKIQMKTRTTLKRLRPVYRSMLIDLLFEAGLLDLDYKNPDDAILAYAELSNVDFGHAKDSDVSALKNADRERMYTYLRMRHANLRNGTFRMAILVDIDLDLVNANLDYFEWTYSLIEGVVFKRCSMNAAVFAHTSLTGVTFDKVQLNEVSFRHVTTCNQCHFVSLSMFKADLSQAKFIGAHFTRIALNNGNLSYSYHKDSQFVNVDMRQANFTRANFTKGFFEDVQLMMCQLSGAKFFDSIFDKVDMTGCNGFDQSNWSKITFRSSIFVDGTFLSHKCLNC